MNTPKFGTALFMTLALLSVGYAAIAQKQLTPPFKGAAVPKPQQKPPVPVQQEGRRAGDYTCIVAIDVLQYYLKLDKEQTTKIEPIVKRVRAELGKLQSMGTDAAPKLMEQVKLLGELFKSSDAEIDNILTSEQKKKVDGMFDEIRKLSSMGIDRDAIAQVKLTDKQKKELITLSEEYQEKNVPKSSRKTVKLKDRDWAKNIVAKRLLC